MRWFYGAGALILRLVKTDVVALFLAVIDLGCWGVCFWWMRTISSKQNDLLEQLHRQGKRIENISRMEHELIKDVHPQVGEIKEGMDEMIAAVKENTETKAASNSDDKR